ncbi:double zinc ribbon domain-containing protein [Pseudomonas sp. Fl4BN1]|uniref:double zinc ribbon domain-containing protein n=1 Tax=Pseudomonas sp. Fl4BN1 TaxID=2697651 RepID=UPI0013781296|nr:zinc ribbon domain-containing protein [Pseudomonas sp. Fl4BN1]NBF09027.1 adenylate cyclase [Pseudomonas sp. Fl4BN1]
MSFFGRLLAGHHGGGHDGSRGGHPGSGHSTGAGSPCPQCRALNPASARFCQQCAASLVPAGCAQCGATLAAGARFCGQCGRASN